MTCNLTSAIVGMGIKHNLEAIVIAIFPVQKGPPSRRHVFLADSDGVTGITVWNQDVNKFPKEVLGGVVKIARASVSIYQGKKSLVLNKESHVEVDTVTRSPLAVWWESVALKTPLPLPAGIIASDNAIINVFGVLAHISHETKEVNGQERRVTTIHMCAQTARLQLRGWDLEPSTLEAIALLQDHVTQVRRIRMTSFGDNKIGEILDSANGTQFLPFTDAALTQFWAE